MDQTPRDRHLARRSKLALAAFATIAGVFLVTEHRAHALAFLPWGLLAVCPLVHLFLHRGHGGGSDPGGHSAPGPRRRSR
jgi:hypothetical protein